MEKVFEIAANLSTPLAVSGFLAAAFFFVAKQILAKNIFPSLSRQLSSEIIKLIIDRLFVLSLVAMVLGFLGYVLPQPKAAPSGRLEEPRAIAVLSAQFEEIQKVSELFNGKTEGDLRDELGFDQMFRQNVDWLFARYRYSVFAEKFDLESVLSVGSVLKILKGGGGKVEYETGKFTPEDSDRIVTYLILPKEFQNTITLLQKFGDSAFLTKETRNLIQEYIALAEDNTIILGDLLDEAARELPDRYPNAKDDMSFIWINNRWVRHFRDLNPKAEEIKDNLRRYVKAG